MVIDCSVMTLLPVDAADDQIVFQAAPAAAAVAPAKPPLALTRRARRMARILHERYPDAHCELDFADPLQLLVATVLSAQSTDVGVNKVTPALFARYPGAADYAAADRDELEALIRPTGRPSRRASQKRASACS